MMAINTCDSVVWRRLAFLYCFYVFSLSELNLDNSSIRRRAIDIEFKLQPEEFQRMNTKTYDIHITYKACMYPVMII